MALEKLQSALNSLSESVSKFPLGAITAEDFSPYEKKIKDMRQILKTQKAHCFLIISRHATILENSKTVSNPANDKSEEDINKAISILHEEIANKQIINTAINICLQSCAIDDLLHKGMPNSDIKKQVKGHLQKLFALNDTLITLQNSMKEALIEELELTIECQKASFDYRAFLKKQKSLRDKKLEETEPEILRNKRKLEGKIQKINIMKKLMTNMIAAAGDSLIGKPFLIDMFKKHREIITIERITEMARETETPNSS